MVNPIIKGRIKNKVPLGAQKILGYMEMLEKSKTVSEDSDTELVLVGGRTRNKFDFFRRNTAEYVFDNFGEILSAITINDFEKLLDASFFNEHMLVAIQRNISEVIERINQEALKRKSNANRITAKIVNLQRRRNLFHEASDFEQFYREIDRNLINLSEFRCSGNNARMPRVYFEVLQLVTEDGTIHPSDICDFIIALRENQEGISFLKENVALFIRRTDTPLCALQLLKGVEFNKEEIKEILNERLDDIVEEMLQQNSEIKVEGSIRNKQNLVKLTVREMVSELLKKQDIQPCQITKIAQGGYSSVYRIGNKIMKFGRSPETYKIPRNSRRFLVPLVRYIQDYCTNNGQESPISIEILERCDTKIDVTPEEIYEVYKEIRQLGMIWTDAKQCNLGRLIKSNRIHFDRVDEVHGPNIGFPDDDKVECLEPGELVVLDLDYIFDESDPKIIWPFGGSISRELEDRYQAELLSNATLKQGEQQTSRGEADTELKSGTR